jgi:hypothetical protein
LRQLDLLSRWLEREGFLGWRADGRACGVFLAAQRAAGYSSLLSVRSTELPLEYLRELGVVPADVMPAVVDDPLERILAGYRRYLVDERGLTELPVARYEAAARLFLTGRVSADGSGVERLEGADVTLFLGGRVPEAKRLDGAAVDVGAAVVVAIPVSDGRDLEPACVGRARDRGSARSLVAARP